MLYVLLVVVFAWGLTTIYLAYRFREFRKFLAGAFFVSWGIQLYLYFAKVSVPLLGTNFVLTPEISGVRSIPHFIFFLLCLYFGFFSSQKDRHRVRFKDCEKGIKGTTAKGFAKPSTRSVFTGVRTVAESAGHACPGFSSWPAARFGPGARGADRSCSRNSDFWSGCAEFGGLRP